jgi:DNA polymerase type B, organellar and viral
MNIIAKLLMNSLYGKFGMAIQQTDVSVFDISKKLEIEKLDNLIESDDKNKLELISNIDREGDLVFITKSQLTTELVALALATRSRAPPPPSSLDARRAEPEAEPGLRGLRRPRHI